MSKNSIWQLSLIGAICLISTLTFGSDRSLAQEDKPDWEYGGSANPTHWDELSPEYKSCKLGNAQSPINIDSYQEGEPTKIEFNYQPTTGEVIDNGHTIQVNYEPGSTVKIDNEVYELTPEQIATFESIYSYNARPIEPLDGRSVEFHPAK